MEFDKTPRFWYPCVALDAWIDFSSRTVDLRPSECRENLHFFLSPLSLFIYIRFIFFRPPVCFPSFLFFFFPFLPFLSIKHPSFCLHPSPFSLIYLIFSLLSFSPFTPLFDHHPSNFPFFFPFFHFLLYVFFFLFSFLFLIWIASTKWSKSGGNFPPLSSIATCHHHNFSFNFLNFLFPLFLSFDTWLNVSHSNKCTTWLMSCVT